MIYNYFKHNLPILIFLTILVVTSYINTLDNQFVSDDIVEILNNPKIIQLANVLEHFSLKYQLGFIRPLFYFLAYHVGGLNPTSFRMINILFHLGNTILIFALVKKLHKSKVALIASAIFAVHPIISEPVSWISGGAYVQTVFFMLLAILFYINSQNSIRSYTILSWIFFTLAVISQVVAVALPAILFVFEFIFSSLRRNWPKLIPFIIIGLFFIFTNYITVGERVNTLQTVHYLQMQTFNPFVIIPIAVTSYLELIFFPKDLTIYHSELTFDLVGFSTKVVGLLLYLGTAMYFFFKNRQIFFWLCLFFISLIPTLVTASLGLTWIVAERYAYFATLGIIIPIALAITRLSKIKILKSVMVILVLALLIGLTIRTILRNNDWQNEDTLWIATGKTSPSSPNNHNNLGDVYGRRGDLPNSIREFQNAIALKPDYADAHHNLGNALIEAQRIDEALQSYQNAIKFNPFLWQSYQNISALYFSQGQYERAEVTLKKAVEINPNSLDLQINLGTVYLKMERYEKAKEIFSQILQVDPNNQKARLGLMQSSKIIP